MRLGFGEGDILVLNRETLRESFQKYKWGKSRFELIKVSIGNRNCNDVWGGELLQNGGGDTNQRTQRKIALLGKEEVSPPRVSGGRGTRKGVGLSRGQLRETI